MNAAPDNVVPLSFDMSALVRRSVASLYSHLVTRPTGQALRMGIESQLAEMGEFCLSLLDFTQVVVLDYSCADEAVAKLILRYLRDDRPADAFFIAHGVAEQHIEPIESVLSRHDLALVAHLGGAGYALLGAVSDPERQAWSALQKAGRADCQDIAAQCQADQGGVEAALQRLAVRRTVIRRNDRSYYSLSSLLA